MADTIIQIPAELFATAESSHFEGSADLPILTVGPDEYHFVAPVKWEVDITNTGSAFLVTGNVTGEAHCDCSRCLGDALYDFEGDIEGYYLIDGAEVDEYADEEDSPGEDEFEVLPEDHRIDLMPLIQAALIVDAPAVPLCKDDCLGLCPFCGADLNEGDCTCDKTKEVDDFEQQANPFAVLADYQFNDN